MGSLSVKMRGRFGLTGGRQIGQVAVLTVFAIGCNGNNVGAGNGGAGGSGTAGGAAAGHAGTGGATTAGGAGASGGFGGPAGGAGGVAGLLGPGGAGNSGAPIQPGVGGAANQPGVGGAAAGGIGTAGGGGGGGVAPTPVTLCGFPMPNAVATGLPTPASYDVSQPGLIIDNVTGLTWERDPDDRSAVLGCTLDGSGALLCPWRYAQMYCEGSRLGGFSDWRLPTILELVSLVDYATQYPTVDTAAFPNTPYEPAWSATRGAGNALDVAWVVQFTDGAIRQLFIDQPQRVRCVRGGGSGTPQARCYQSNARFQADSTAAVVTDAAPGLVRQKGSASSARSLADATAQCAALGAGTRVPSINELLTLVDFTRSPSSSALIDTAVFSQPGTFTWSSTVALTQYMSEWTLSFADATMALAGFTNGVGEVRCVR